MIDFAFYFPSAGAVSVFATCISPSATYHTFVFFRGELLPLCDRRAIHHFKSLTKVLLAPETDGRDIDFLFVLSNA